jgi:hypothetical protein
VVEEQGTVTFPAGRRAGQSTPAYADTVGKFVAGLEANSGHQLGDPVRAVTAIRQLAAAAEPPP